MHGLPDLLRDEAELEELLTRPSADLVKFIRTVESPLVILGASGKMGPTLALKARRAAECAGHRLEVIAVSRFTDATAQKWLEQKGISTLACDLLDRAAVARLPESPNIISLIGLKFGTSKNPAATWALNTLGPAHVVERYPSSRIVALSTGNVYPFSSVRDGGSLESASVTPLGEYANAAVARERIFEYAATQHQSSLALLRLFYAVEMRYGIVVDIAHKIAQGSPIDLRTGYFNCIWQGDANEMILRSLALCSTPPSAWNLCFPEVFSVRETALKLGDGMKMKPKFVNEPTETALLGNSSKLVEALGRPSTEIEQVILWTAQWVTRGGRNLGRPTHFEVRDGVY